MRDPGENLLLSWFRFLTRKLSIVRRMKANYNHGQMPWDTFEFLGRFPIHTHPAPPLTPQTTLDACFQTFLAPVATLYRVGEGELPKNFEKDALFYGSLCSDTPLSRPIVTEGREGGSVHRLFYEGAQKVQKVIITIMNTFPKTFVQDCSYFYHHYFPFSHVCFFIFL